MWYPVLLAVFWALIIMQPYAFAEHGRAVTVTCESVTPLEIVTNNVSDCSASLPSIPSFGYLTVQIALSGGCPELVGTLRQVRITDGWGAVQSRLVFSSQVANGIAIITITSLSHVAIDDGVLSLQVLPAYVIAKDPVCHMKR